MIAWTRGPTTEITKSYKFTDKLQVNMIDKFDKISNFYQQKEGY